MTEHFRSHDQRGRGGDRIAHAADIYHKHVYRRISSTMGSVTDQTDLPLSEPLLPVVTTAAFVANEDSLPISIRAAANVIQFGFLISAGLYIPNIGRTPLSEKLGLQEREFSIEDEMQYVINQLNQRADSPQLDFDQLVPLAHDTLTDYLKEKDGYRTDGAKKIKKARWLRTPMKKMGARGLMNPMINEIVTTSDTFDDVPAHEFAHSKGVVQEAQAQIAGVLSQIESGNTSLEYIGYKAWLWMLIRATGFDPTVSVKQPTISELQIFGLNERTLQELQERVQYARTQKYGSKLGRSFNDIKLKALGQTDTLHAYATKPLAYLADYRTKIAQ